MNRIAIRLSIILSLILYFVSSAAAQKGYIYVHVNALNEGSSPDFQFSINGGPTLIPNFFLNDQPLVTDRTNDIGASHGVTANGLGDGELWASMQLSGDIYHRLAGSSQWTATGLTGTSLDGAGPGQFVNVDANGNAYFYDGVAQQIIYTAAAHAGLKATDITYGNGRIAVTLDDGSIWTNDGITTPYTDAWTMIAAVGTNAGRLDILPSSGLIVYYNTGSGTIFRIPFTGGVATNMGTPGTTDIAFDDDGNIYANGYRWGGATNWIPDATRNSTFNRTTAGPAGQVWCTADAPNIAGTIYTRTADQIWLDDERIRAAYTGNAIILPVDAGAYTLSAVIPPGWSLTSFALHDPSANSTFTLSAAQATLDVSAGEVVHIVVREALLVPLAISQACGVISTDDFGTAPSAPLLTTDYHYHNSNTINDGYYAIHTTDATGTLTDHTTGTGNMMLVNGTAQRDAFYRKRLTNLLSGQPYKLSFWVANANTAAPVKPDILAGLAATDGTVLSSFSTGAVNNGSWTQYTFSFTAPSNTADIFLLNNAGGSNGNDLALDDIAIIPMAGVLPSNTMNPSTPGLCEGTGATIANSTTGGTWSTNNPAVAVVDATGKLSAISAGYADITYTLTDASGCQATAITTIPVYELPSVTATVSSTSICTGSNINLSATANNTAGPYTYQWSSSPITGGAIADDQLQNTTADPSLPGSTYTYIAMATDTRGCTGTAVTSAVTVNGLPVATISYPVDLCSTGTATVTQTGVTGGTYSGSTGLTIDAVSGTIDLQASTTGAHTITYTFNDGQCTGTTTANVVIHNVPAVDVITGPSALCQAEQIILNNSTTGGVWSSADNTIATIDASGILTGTGAGTTTAVYTITDSYGCVNNTTASITVNPLPQATIAYAKPVFCVVGTADIIQTGVSGGSFSTSAGLVIDTRTGQLDLAASQPGTYTVNYAFTNGTCNSNVSTVVTLEGAPVIAPITGKPMACINRGTQLSCLSPGGSWSSSDINVLLVDAAGYVSGLSAGNAIVTYQITTASGCVNKTDFAMQVPPLPVFTTSTTAATCSNRSDGSITVQTVGTGYKYAINEGDWKDENIFSNLAGDDYSVQIINADNCISLPQTVTVSAPRAIGLIVTPKDITCHGENSGSLALAAVGGTPPYRVQWSTGATNNKIINLPAGDYSVTVTDQQGCSSSLSIQLTELFPVFVVNDPVKQEGGLLNITGEAMPRADILVTYPDGSITTTHTDARGGFSTLSPGIVGTGGIVVTVTDPITKGTCKKYIDYNNSTTADLSIIKTMEIAAAAPTVGDEVHFTITANDKGLDHASRVIVSDDISNMLEEIGNIAVTGGNAVFNTRTRQVVWNIDTLYVNKPLQLSFTARITRGGVLENTAVISGQQADPDESNNTSTVEPVEISPDLFIPNVITANGDGRNDYFMVRGIDQYPGSTLEVYNRWGNQVYRSGNYANNWGGAGLAAGIYYYVLKINMSRAVKVYKGYIELIQK